MQQPSLKLSVLTLAVLSSLHAHAQTTPNTKTKGETELETIKVTASADASAQGLSKPYPGGQVARGSRIGVLGQEDNMATPFNVTSYTRTLISDQQAASIGDVLQNDPAVRVARGFGNYQQLYIVRGLPVYSDDMSYNGLYGLLPRQYLATEIVERVEVLRGANAFLNGAAPGGSGLGGSVNVVPKRAGNDPLTQVSAGLQTGGQGYVATDFSRRSDDDRLGLRLNAAYHDGDMAVDGAKSKLTIAGIGLDYQQGYGRISFDLGYQDQQLKANQPSFDVASGLAIPGAPDAASAIAQPWTFSNERDIFGTIRGEYDFTKHITGWAAFGVREGQESSNFANPRIVNAAGDTSTYSLATVRHDSIQTGEIGVRSSFATGSVGHKVSLSATQYELKSRNAYGFSDFAGFPGNIYNPFPVPAPANTALIGGNMNDPGLTERLQTWSVALADAMSFLNDKLFITLGARYQHFDDKTYDYNTGAETPGSTNGAVTPVGGIVYRITPRISAYINYIEGMQKGDIAPVTVGNVIVVNAGEAMDPYKTEQIEAGFKFDAGRIGGTVNIYQTRKPVAGVSDTGVYSIVGHQRYRGLELSTYGEIIRSLKILGGLSFLDTDLDGNYGIGAPKIQGNIGLDWDVPQLRGLSVDGRVIYTGSQYADTGNTQKLPSWTRLDLGARYVTGIGDQALTLRARVENVTNKNYWASAGGYPGAGYLTLGAPRTWIVSATVDF